MKKSVLVVSVMIGLLSGGCAPLRKLEPFVDIDETIQLTPRMNQDRVLDILGQPLEVRAGLLLNNDDLLEIWVYNVRYKLWETRWRQKTPKKFVPNDWGESHRLALFFRNEELMKWGYLEDNWPDYLKEDGEILGPVGMISSGDEESESSGFMGRMFNR